MDGLVDDFASDISTTGVLEVDGTATGVIDFEGDRDFFAIELTAGDLVRIESNIEPDTSFTVRDEFGNVVAFSGAPGVELFLVADVEESGTFFIDFGASEGSSLEYILTATAIEDDFADDTSTIGVLEVGSAVAGALHSLSDRDFFAIQLTAGEAVRIATDGIGEDLVLRDEFGNMIAQNGFDPETGQDFLFANVEESGTFFVEVLASNDVALDYTLSATVVEDSATVVEDDFAGDRGNWSY